MRSWDNDKGPRDEKANGRNPKHNMSVEFDTSALHFFVRAQFEGSTSLLGCGGLIRHIVLALPPVETDGISSTETIELSAMMATRGATRVRRFTRGRGVDDGPIVEDDKDR